ncbi:cytochrome P450 [Colletotrichum eremochloae]|nr:cytochrome P450 [Colletotrichum eremochloae]
MIVTVSLLLASYVVYWTVRLASNISKAKSTGLPVRWTPVSPANPFWIVLGKPISRLLRAVLPPFLSDWTYFNTIDWHWLDRLHHDCAVHKQNGDTFMQATPSGLQLHTRDPAVAEQLMKTCPKPDHIAKPLEGCGPNLVSSSDEDWPRHRKITVSTLSDRNNRLVWAETVRQTSGLVRSYQARGGNMTNPQEDIRRLYLNMFSAVCFGKPLEFDQTAGGGKVPEGHQRSYRYCLETSLRDIFIMHVVPRWVAGLPSVLVPRKIAEFFAASREMLQYLDEMIKACRDELRDGGEVVPRSGDNLLRITVRNGLGFKGQGEEQRSRMYLADDEVRGNLFIYSLGGHESNAHTFTYALYFLAAYPDAQEWLAEELEASCPADADLETEETYFGIMSKLQRTLAVMHETLRLYPSIIFLPKTTASECVTLHLGCDNDAVAATAQRPILLPPRTNIWVNMCGMQVHPDVWGADARAFRPSRWIGGGGGGGGATGADEFAAPSMAAGAAFVAWGGGKRVCPGVKFSQAAFAAGVASLLVGGGGRRRRVRVVPREGEGEAAARQRAMEVLDDSYAGTTVLMRRPGDVRLRLVDV